MVFLGFHHKVFAVANATEISTKVWVLHSVPPSQFPIQQPSKRFRHQGHHVLIILDLFRLNERHFGDLQGKEGVGDLRTDENSPD